MCQNRTNYHSVISVEQSDEKSYCAKTEIPPFGSERQLYKDSRVLLLTHPLVFISR